jgi:hypothetical protein
VDEAHRFLADDETIRARMSRVTALIEGFEDPYGLELLSSVHWVMKEKPAARESAEVAVTEVHRWNARKQRTLKKEHIFAAWERLKGQDWSESFAAA